MNPSSRFLREIPLDLRQTSGVGSTGFVGTGWEKRGSRRGISGSGTEAGKGRVTAAAQTFAVGDVVDHKTFGRGTVKKVDGDVLHVRFDKSGETKKLLKDYAPIVKIGS